MMCVYFSDVHLLRPFNVDILQAVAALVSLHSDGHVVVAVEHDQQWQHEVDSDHCHRVGDERAGKEKLS